MGLFYLGALLYLEIAFHLVHFQALNGEFLYSCLFLVPVVGVMWFATSFGKRGIRMAVSYVLQSVACLLYIVQQVYCYIFKTYLSAFSATTGGGQVLEFWREALHGIWKSVPFILLYAVPVVALAGFWYWQKRHEAKKQEALGNWEVLAKEAAKKVAREKALAEEHKGVLPWIRAQWAKSQVRTWLWRVSILVLALSLHFGVVAGLRLQGTDYYTAYDLYHYTPAMDISVWKLGLLTSVRLDAKRLLFGMDEERQEEDIEETWEETIIEDHSPDSEEKEIVSDGLEEVVNETAGEEVTGENPEADVTGEATGEEVAELPEEPTWDTSPNVLEIDFETLIAEAPTKTVAEMHQYFQNSSITNKNKYTGMFEGYNLIMITAEGFSPYAVHEELTPTLYKLTHEGFVFDNFYTPLWGVSTSDGEYVACTGLLPKSGVWSFYRSGSNAMPFGLGNQFSKLGYQCRAYHDHTFDYYSRDISHPNMGYEYKGVGNGLEIKESWPESDLEMMEVTIPEYIGQEPFHTYYMTVSGHLYYTFLGNSMSNKNRSLVADLPYPESAQAYIACNIELDRALEHLIQELEAAGIADHTVIALSADHYPYGLEKEVMDELAGHVVEENFELYKNHFILWTPSIEEPIHVEKAACSMDIIPTLCNLFGLEYDSRMFMGRDLLSEEHQGLVIFGNRSFITDKVMFNSMTGEMTKLTEEELPEDYLRKMNKIVNDKFQYSAKILEEDYYQYILPYME